MMTIGFFEVQPLAALTSKIVDAFLNVLGWRRAVQGKKAVGFCSQPVALGCNLPWSIFGRVTYWYRTDLAGLIELLK